MGFDLFYLAILPAEVNEEDDFEELGNRYYAKPGRFDSQRAIDVAAVGPVGRTDYEKHQNR